MLLGQLFYFEKELNKLSQPLNLSGLNGVEIAGIGKIDASIYSHLAENDWKDDLKDKFIQNYQDILDVNQLAFASSWWNEMANPNISDNQSFSPKTEFETELVNWSKKSYYLNDLQNILRIGSLSSSESDFALYYGLHVLSLLSNFDNNIVDSSTEKTDIDNFQNAEFQLEKQILVVGSNYLKPLFHNLNCQFLIKVNSSEKILAEIKECLKNNNFLELILVEELDNDLNQFLIKKLPANLLISSLDFNSQKDNYFDFIVKKALGVKLPNI